MNGSPPLHVYRKIATTFIAITIVLVFVIFYFTLTYAFVSVTPNVQEVSYDYNISVTSDDSKVDTEKGVFKGTLINQESSAEQVFSATGKLSVVSEAAGKVMIINTATKTQPLVKTTRLLTKDNVLFRISENVNVAPGEKIEVAVYQDDPTAPVSVKASDKFTIPGLNINLQEQIYAEASSDFTGKVSVVTFVSKSDLDTAAATMRDAMYKTLIDTLPADSEIVLQTEILTKEFSNLADDKVESFTAKMSIRFTGAVVAKDALDTFKVRILESDLSDQVQLNEVTSTTYLVDTADLANNTVQIKAHVVATAVIRKDADILNRDKMIGLNQEELVSYLQNFKEVKSAEVKFFPFWVRSVPSFTDHIMIEVKQP